MVVTIEISGQGLASGGDNKGKWRGIGKWGVIVSSYMTYRNSTAVKLLLYGVTTRKDSRYNYTAND